MEARTHWEIRTSSRSKLGRQHSSRNQMTVYRWPAGHPRSYLGADGNQEPQAKKLGNKELGPGQSTKKGLHKRSN